MEEENGPIVEESARKETILRAHAQELLRERFNVDWFEICEALQSFSRKTWPFEPIPWSLCKSIAEEETAGRKASIHKREERIEAADAHAKMLNEFGATGRMGGTDNGKTGPENGSGPQSESFPEDEEDKFSPTPGPWPKPMRPEAFTGIVNEIMERIMPQSEADPHGILVSFLIGFGNILGKGLHLYLGNTEHPPRLAGVLVGPSSLGAKGTATSAVLELLQLIDPIWAKNCISGGLSSGEGLIEAVRDDWTETNKKGEIKVQKGVTDKRLLLIEGEFGRVLSAKGRDGSVLSQVLRSAWDHHGTLSLMNRKKIYASWSMISAICHITEMELKELLAKSDIFNGFANRYLWILVQLSKLIALPERGWAPGWIESGIASQLQDMARRSGALGRVEFDEEAAALWVKNYPKFRVKDESQAGVVMARSAPIAARLALVYMALGGETMVRKAHVESALAVMEYSRDSIRQIFPSSIGNHLVNKIFDLLKGCGPAGASRVEIRKVLGHHVLKKEIDRALSILLAAGRVEPPLYETGENGGKAKEIWKLKR